MTTPSIQFPLDRGERQLWSGAPRRGFVLRPADTYMIPFSLFWAGFAVFWEASVVRQGAPLLFALFGLPLVLVGIYITIGRFFVDRQRRARTAYAVTSDRVIISSGILSPSIKSLSLTNLSDITLTERADGSGTITFGPVYPWTMWYAGAPWPGVAQTPSFELIPGARQVYDIIRDAQQEARKASPLT